MKYFYFSLVKKKIVEFEFVHYKVKQTKTNLQKKCPPLLLKPTDMCACAMPRAKKGQQKVPILKKTIVICLSWSYYSMGQPLKQQPPGTETMGKSAHLHGTL